MARSRERANRACLKGGKNILLKHLSGINSSSNISCSKTKVTHFLPFYIKCQSNTHTLGRWKNYLHIFWTGKFCCSLYFCVKHEENISHTHTGRQVFITHKVGNRTKKTLSYSWLCLSLLTLICCHWEKFIDFLLQPTIQQRVCMCFSFNPCVHFHASL